MGDGITVCPDAAMRLAVNRAVAIETTRGWRIGKQACAHEIDIVVALAMAAWAAVQRALTRHAVVVERAIAPVAKIDAALAQGDIRFFNTEYRRRRKAAAGRFMRPRSRNAKPRAGGNRARGQSQQFKQR